MERTGVSRDEVVHVIVNDRVDGEPCGGLQKHHERPGMELYPVIRRQSWCALGYLAMVGALFLGHLA